MIAVTRPGRGDITTTRSERNTASGIEWVTNTTVVPVSAQMRIELGLHVLAGHLVEGAEGLVHEQQGRVEGQRAGDGHPLLHPPESSHGWWSANSASFTSSSMRQGLLAAAGLVPPSQLERQLDVLGHGAPLEQAGLLERHAVVLIEAGLLGRLAVHGDGAGGRVGEVGDEAQQRALAAPGRADQRHELARADVRSMSTSAATSLALARVEDLADAGD